MGDQSFIKLRVGDMAVLKSGCLVIPLEQPPIEIELDDGDGILIVRVIFEVKPGEPISVPIQIINPTLVELRAINFNNNSGASFNKTPIAVAFGHVIFLSMAVFVINTQYIVHYTIYQGPAHNAETASG